MLNQIPPWISVLVSLISFLGLLVVARHNAEAARNLARLREDFEIAAEKRQKADAIEFANLKAALDRKLESDKIFVRLNEENWKRVHKGILVLRDRGFAMTAAFKALANRSWSHIEISQDQLVSDSLRALRRHDEFRNSLKALRAEIRSKDHDSLERLLKYLVIVFLDVGRTPAERRAKSLQMQKHERIIIRNEERFQKMMEHFLQPYL